MVDVVMKLKFGIKKYFQVLNGVGPGYGGLTQFIIIDKHVRFPGEGYNFSFTDAEYHVVNSAPTLYRVNV
jgi:hypothetical protein